jgi:hypothetical protein
MAHLKLVPLDGVETGVIYYGFHFDQTVQFSNPIITSKSAVQEVDFSFGLVGDRAAERVGRGRLRGAGCRLKQGAQAFVTDNGPP